MEITYKKIKEAADKETINVHGSKPSQDRIHFKVGFISGAEWMQEQLHPGWISVTKRLPENDGFVLTLRVGTLPHIVSSFYTPNSVPIEETGWYNVTHWMPLPEPPKQ